ncbi:hypothetical protein R3P38DRAFT_2691089, partial [Favolaschia claudopus]
MPPNPTSMHQAHSMSDEAAGVKIWSIYISEAERYDKALINSWRSDMEGLLIFAGLFSTILTAFIIESYKTLSPDIGQNTLLVLQQISRTISNSTSGNTLADIPAPEFIPPPSSVLCNSLWFLSLGLSLSSALVATLVEQWARNFIQKTEMRSSPIIRARLFSYLYYGLKRFQMHVIVELVPLLLHCALFLFFAGLVAFLYPIHAVLTALVATFLTLVASVYIFATVLPIFHSDCPYWTPVSSLAWCARGIIRLFLHHIQHEDSSGEAAQAVACDGLVHRMTVKAVVDSPERTERDTRALCWTLKSLTDDGALEPFLEGIPDLIHDSANRRRYVYDDRIRLLLNDSELQLGARMANLIRMSDTGLLPSSVQTRRITSCLKAMWAIAQLAESSSHPQPFYFIQETHLFSDFIQQDPSLRHYSTSAFALVMRSRLCS